MSKHTPPEPGKPDWESLMATVPPLQAASPTCAWPVARGQYAGTCKYRGTVERYGRLYCGRHAPLVEPPTRIVEDSDGSLLREELKHERTIKAELLEALEVTSAGISLMAELSGKHGEAASFLLKANAAIAKAKGEGA